MAAERAVSRLLGGVSHSAFVDKAAIAQKISNSARVVMAIRKKKKQQILKNKKKRVRSGCTKFVGRNLVSRLELAGDARQITPQ